METSQRASADAPPPLVIRAQGSFAVGGTVVRNPGSYDPATQAPAGQTLRGDHATVTYQLPVDARPLPLVFLHGGGQCSRSWQTTPDGREGFQNLFLRRGFPVYLVDQPRRGNAGRSAHPGTIAPVPDEQRTFDGFRLGIWPDYFPGVQFPRDAESLDQYLRQGTPDTAPFDPEVIAAAMAALFERIGPGILVTHSQGGGPGWLSAIRSPKVRAIVSYEPGSNFIFPQGEVPPPLPAATAPLHALGVPREDFIALTRIPIVLYYGDNIAAAPVPQKGPDHWRVRLAMARLWAEAVNRHGGDARVVHLPELGIRGNTHFPFSDLNNLQVADLLSDFLRQKGLD
ncbi:MAG TPA: alpha/beta fold hydrolase [Ramlibacter sp.]|nr:alpha/beta fold hydrolase [Ramlibacter sp.]